jgi:hypothetical protein
MDFFMAALFAGVLAGAFVETEGRRRRKEATEINQKLDLLLRHVGALSSSDEDRKET